MWVMDKKKPLQPREPLIKKVTDDEEDPREDRDPRRDEEIKRERPPHHN